jgi:hypothetical protein
LRRLDPVPISEIALFHQAHNDRQLPPEATSTVRVKVGALSSRAKFSRTELAFPSPPVAVSSPLRRNHARSELAAPQFYGTALVSEVPAQEPQRHTPYRSTLPSGTD